MLDDDVVKDFCPPVHCVFDLHLSLQGAVSFKNTRQGATVATESAGAVATSLHWK